MNNNEMKMALRIVLAEELTKYMSKGYLDLIMKRVYNTVDHVMKQVSEED